MLSHNILKSFQQKLLVCPNHHPELKDVVLSSYLSSELPWLRVVSFKVTRPCEAPVSSNSSIQSVGVRTILSRYGSLSPPHRVGWAFTEDGQQPYFCLRFILSFFNPFLPVLSPGDPHQRICISRNETCDIITSLVFLMLTIGPRSCTNWVSTWPCAPFPALHFTFKGGILTTLSKLISQNLLFDVRWTVIISQFWKMSLSRSQYFKVAGDAKRVRPSLQWSE